jgi:hypothetical protein
MVNSNNSETIIHTKSWELLPWYVNGTLHDSEWQLVDDHIRGCKLCEVEVRRCAVIAAAVRIGDTERWTPSAERIKRILARLS